MNEFEHVPRDDFLQTGGFNFSFASALLRSSFAFGCLVFCPGMI